MGTTDRDPIPRYFRYFGDLSANLLDQFGRKAARFDVDE